jgi:hypothetical protein
MFKLHPFRIQDWVFFYNIKLFVNRGLTFLYIHSSLLRSKYVKVKRTYPDKDTIQIKYLFATFYNNSIIYPRFDSIYMLNKHLFFNHKSKFLNI